MRAVVAGAAVVGPGGGTWFNILSYQSSRHTANRYLDWATALPGCRLCVLSLPLPPLTRKTLKHNYPPAMDYHERITIDPGIRSGKPCIRGTRITVADVFDYLGGGMTIPQVLDDFPDLTAEDIQACFAFAADRDRRLNVIPHEAAL